MKFIYLLVCQLGCLSFLIGCNEPPSYLENSKMPFFKQYTGHIGNRPAVLNLMKTGQCSYILFMGFFYYTDEVMPIFFKGSHFFYPTNESGVPTVLVDNYKIEQRLIDTLKYTTDTIDIVVHPLSGHFRGRFNNDSTFIGVLRCEDKKDVPFEFKEMSHKNNLNFNIWLSQKDTILDVGVNKNVKVELTLDLTKPMRNMAVDTSLQKAMFKILTNCDNIINDTSQINACLGHAASDRFAEYKTWQATQLKLESVVLPIYNKRNILSILCLNNFDTDRRNGSRSSVFSYNLEKKQIIQFDDIFKTGSKDKIFTLIKSQAKRRRKSLYNFEENRFYLTHKNITFMFTGEEENRYSETGEEFTYSFDELKDMIKPTFRDILK